MSDPDELSPELRSLLRAALDMDQDERAYLIDLKLAARWRAQPAAAQDSAWGWIALLGVVSAFVAWSFVFQPFTNLVDMANVVGFGTVLLTSLVGLLLSLIGSFIDVATNPA